MRILTLTSIYPKEEEGQGDQRADVSVTDQSAMGTAASTTPKTTPNRYIHVRHGNRIAKVRYTSHFFMFDKR